MTDDVDPGAGRDVDLDVDLDTVWERVRTHVWAPRVGRVETLARVLLRSPGLARALVTTPSLLLSWIVATAAVLLVGGTLLTLATGQPMVALLAPALAGIGIAYAYGPGTDPAYELASSMPVSDRMVLLVRAVAVFGLNAGLGVVASTIVPGAHQLTLSWLVPMTAVAAVALAAATLADSAHVGVALGLAGWFIAVLAGHAATGRIDAAVADHAFALPYVGVTVACVAIVLSDNRLPTEQKRGWS
ncbi:MAG TPA: hypothetical protein VHF06_14870 [Pseudonocardiaceae bacterium]|jgi:hypothetical protein|nr:hypothetical protein [Pseudonocardiaceae bacterium]